MDTIQRAFCNVQSRHLSIKVGAFDTKISPLISLLLCSYKHTATMQAASQGYKLPQNSVHCSWSNFNMNFNSYVDRLCLLRDLRNLLTIILTNIKPQTLQQAGMRNDT